MYCTYIGKNFQLTCIPRRIKGVLHPSPPHLSPLGGRHHLEPRIFQLTLRKILKNPRFTVCPRSLDPIYLVTYNISIGYNIKILYCMIVCK